MGDLTSGINALQPIESIINLDNSTVGAPKFRHAVAGVDSNGFGEMHSVFIDLEGNVYSTGNNNKGQLCLGDVASREIPTQITLPNSEKASSVAVGGEFTLILTTTGTVYGCGSNEFGQLGLGGSVSQALLPDDGNGLSEVTSISAGLDFSFVGKAEELFVMGDNTFGESNTRIAGYCLVAALTQTHFVNIAIPNTRRPTVPR